MPTFVITAKEVGKKMREEDARVKRAIRLAPQAAAQRLRTFLVFEIDRRKITDQGILKGSIRVVQTKDGATVRADAPHAGIIELGCRPHPVSAEGRAAIAEWCVRKLGVDEPTALRMAWFISKKIADRGQPPTFVFRDALPMGRTYLDQELTRILNARAA